MQELRRVRDIIFFDRSQLVGEYKRVFNMSQDDRDNWSDDFNCNRYKWRQRVESYVSLARKWFNEGLIEQCHIEMVVASYRKMERTWNDTDWIDDTLGYAETKIFPAVEGLLSLITHHPPLYAKIVNNPLLSSSPSASTERQSIDIAEHFPTGDLAEMSPVSSPNAAWTQDGKATKPTPPIITLPRAHDSAIINEQLEKELESVRKENEALHRRLQDVEASANDRVEDVEKEKER